MVNLKLRDTQELRSDEINIERKMCIFDAEVSKFFDENPEICSRDHEKNIEKIFTHNVDKFTPNFYIYHVMMFAIYAIKKEFNIAQLYYNVIKFEFSKLNVYLKDINLKDFDERLLSIDVFTVKNSYFDIPTNTIQYNDIIKVNFNLQKENDTEISEIISFDITKNSFKFNAKCDVEAHSGNFCNVYSPRISFEDFCEVIKTYQNR